MNRLVALLLLALLLLGGALLFLLARPEPASRSEVPMASGPAADEPVAGKGEADIMHIPPQFQGAWAPDRLSCASRGETARVDIDAAGMKFYESSGRLVQVSPLNGGREYAITLDMVGEGQRWARVIHLRRVGHELAFRDAEGPEEVLYLRC